MGKGRIATPLAAKLNKAIKEWNLERTESNAPCNEARRLKIEGLAQQLAELPVEKVHPREKLFVWASLARYKKSKET